MTELQGVPESIRSEIRLDPVRREIFSSAVGTHQVLGLDLLPMYGALVRSAFDKRFRRLAAPGPDTTFGGYSPILIEARWYLGPNETLSLFNHGDIDRLENVIWFTREIGEGALPVFALPDLPIVLDAFRWHLQRHGKSIIQDGVADDRFVPSPWLEELLGGLYTLPTIPGDGGPLPHLIEKSDAEKVDALRPRVLQAKIAVLEVLARHIVEGRGGVLLDDCLGILGKAFDAGEIDLLIDVDRRLAGVDPSTLDALPDRRDRPLMCTGGISYLFRLIGHCQRELRTGTMHKVRRQLDGLIRSKQISGSWTQIIGFTDYYPLVRAGRQGGLDAAYDTYRDLKKADAAFWREYWERVDEGVRERFKKTVLVSFSADRKYAEGLETFVIDRGREWLTYTQRWGRPPSPGDLIAEQEDEAQESVFRREGENWTVAFSGTRHHGGLKHRKGMMYLAYLMEHPNKDFRAEELLIATGELQLPATSANGTKGRESEVADPGSTLQFATAQEIMSPEARSALESRIQDLRDKIEEAREFGRVEDEVLHDDEMAKLVAELNATIRRGGKSRLFGTDESRNASKVDRAIRTSIDAIREVHEPLGDHLLASFHGGTRFGYRPSSEIRWKT